MVRNHDRTEFLVRDPGDQYGAAFICSNVAEAYDHWREAQELNVPCDVYEFNPVECVCNLLNDDFADWLEEERREARSQARHENSYRVPA